MSHNFPRQKNNKKKEWKTNFVFFASIYAHGDIISYFFYFICFSLLRRMVYRYVSQFPHHVKFDKLFFLYLFTFYLLFVRMRDKQQVESFPRLLYFICVSIWHHQREGSKFGKDVDGGKDCRKCVMLLATAA